MLCNENELRASLCRDSFFEFVKEFWDTAIATPMVLNWHIEFLCNELQFVAERVFKNLPKLYDLVINISPGTTKSTICSQMFPAWVWTRMGHAQMIHISYAHDISLKDALQSRDIVNSQKYVTLFPGIQVREDMNTKGLFMNTKRGYRLSVGVLGQITGRHGHFLMVDDPLDPERSYSDLALKKANRWVETTLSSRKVDKEIAVTVLIQQRLHENDPSGMLLQKASEGRVRIKHICLPGELTEDVSPPELKAKYIDGLFDVSRLSRAALDAMREDMGEYAYAAQFLQSPVPLAGGMFEVDKFNLVDGYPGDLIRVVRAWDKAGTDDDGAWSVGTLMGVDKKNKFWILDMVRGRWRATVREEKIKMCAEEDGYECEILLEIEGGSGGKESGESTVRNLAGFRVTKIHPTGDKQARAYPMASQVGSGNIYVLKRSWTKDFLREFKFFPNGRFADIVDSCSLGFNQLARRKVRIGGAWRVKHEDIYNARLLVGR